MIVVNCFGVMAAARIPVVARLLPIADQNCQNCTIVKTIILKKNNLQVFMANSKL